MGVGIRILDLVYEKSEEVYGHKYVEKHAHRDNERHLAREIESASKNIPFSSIMYPNNVGYNFFSGYNDEQSRDYV